MSTALIQTTRSIGQMRATLARIALAASEIAATYERSPGVPFVSDLSGVGIR